MCATWQNVITWRKYPLSRTVLHLHTVVISLLVKWSSISYHSPQHLHVTWVDFLRNTCIGAWCRWFNPTGKWFISLKIMLVYEPCYYFKIFPSGKAHVFCMNLIHNSIIFLRHQVTPWRLGDFPTSSITFIEMSVKTKCD